MASKKDFDEGYQSAIETLKRMIEGGDSDGKNGGQSGLGSGLPKGKDSAGNGAQTPELNDKDARKAKRNAKKNGKEGGQEGVGEKGQGGELGPDGDVTISYKGPAKGGDSQASARARQNAAEAGISQGGFVDQKTGAEIAKSEGYDGEDVKEYSQNEITRQWTEAVIDTCSHNNSPGYGNIVTRFDQYYKTSHDWKNDLKKYIGRALNNREYDTKWGNKKWLAQGELKKTDKDKQDALDSVIFLIDCSGSISDKLLQRLISECYTIVKAKKIRKVTYAYYDNGIRQIDTNDTLKFDGVLDPKMVGKLKGYKPGSEIHGRGGNYESLVMSQLEDELKKKNKHPELVMWFSDGETNSVPKKPKRIKNMIWVVYNNTRFQASDNSKVIRINMDDLEGR